jgi:hypothetical protein
MTVSTFNKNTTLIIRQYLQGSNPNLIGTIIGFRKSIKNNEVNYQLSQPTVIKWFSVLFYYDHLSGSIERYAVNKDDKNNI